VPEGNIMLADGGDKPKPKVYRDERRKEVKHRTERERELKEAKYDETKENGKQRQRR
jgi:hypothetical protein